VWKVGPKIGEEMTGNTAVTLHCAAAQGRRESLETSVKHFLERGGWSMRTRDVLTVSGASREILGKDEVGRGSMLLPGQLSEDAPESREVDATGFIGQGRMLISEAANPTEQMGIAAQL